MYRLRRYGRRRLLRQWGLLALGAGLVAAGSFAFPAQPRAAEPPVYADDGLAIRGYDPVAYFRQGKPVKGSSAHTLKHMGATWRFVSAANRDAFRANPAKYAPQFGGYCAWAVSRGYTASIDPDAWKIVGGKLYLNYSRSVQRAWEKDIPGNIRRGEANWPKVLNR